MDFILCEKCKKEPAIARVITDEEEQLLIGEKCLKEGKIKILKKYDSFREMVKDLYKTRRDPSVSQKKREEANRIIDELWRSLGKFGFPKRPSQP